MCYLPYLTSVDAEITLEKLDRVARTLSEKIKNFVKYFCIFLGWCIFNFIVWACFCRTRSLSLDSFRLINEGFHSVVNQDVLFILTFVFDDKIICFISLAVISAFEVAFFVRFLNLESDNVVEARENKHEKYAQNSARNEALVVSYKQQVAFLS